MDLSGVIDGIARRVPVDDETYTGDDGLLYCSRCHTARQSRVELFGNIRVVPCICRCMVEQMNRDEEEKRKREKDMELRRFRELGFPDREMQRYTFAVDDGSMPKITEAMKAYVENFHKMRADGKGLLLWGDVGTGKTFYSACLVNALIDRGYPCLMTNFSRLTNQLSGMWDDKQDFIDGLGRFALIAIDDLGVERDTEYMNESVTTIIDTLYRNKTPLVITSNYTPKQLVEETEIRRRRVFDRLLERCYPIKVNAPSRRKQQGRDDLAEMKELLGV